jgi:phosphate-selective porin OprO/OprP
MFRLYTLIGTVAVMIWAHSAMHDACFAQELPLSPSTAEQIDFLQQQIDQLKLETGLTTPTQPAWLQQSGDPAMHGLPTVPAANLPILQAPLPAPAAPVKVAEKKYPDYRITGFFQLDSAYFAQSSASTATLGDIQDGTTFRRARLAATGNSTERTSYIMEFDFAQAQPRFVDLWGQINDTPLGNIRIGRFRQPNGMSELTSVRELPFLERPTIFALTALRQTGIMFFDTAFDESATWAVSGSRTLSDNFGNVYGDDGGYGIAERITWLPIDGGDCRLLHFGLDHNYNDPARNLSQLASFDEIFAGQQPNFGATSLSVQPIDAVPAFVNSGVFNIDYSNAYNVEAALSFGRALIQSEYRWLRPVLTTGESVTIPAGYATVRYVLTGETIPYNRTAGVFGRIEPDNPLDISKGKFGAWEVAGRISSINLNPLFGLPGITGPTRRLLTSSLGLNWYWWTNAKCQFEWVNGGLNDPAAGNSVSNTLATRVQFDF